MQGDTIENVYFMIKGQASLCVPSIHWHQFVKINEGDSFGFSDFIGSLAKMKKGIDNWYESRGHMRRIFSALSITESETMSLSLDNLYRIEQEYPD